MPVPRIPLALSLCLVSTTAVAQRGIILDDMNPDVAACTDFYEHANGNWRAQHAIPDYMDRWSRRWQSGELNKEHVRDILAEVSARQDWPAGSAEQLAGDFYAACMDETRVNELGIAPALPLLQEIQAIKTGADVQNVLTHLHRLGIPVPFAVYSTQDLHDPNLMIAQVDASGLGLPDRDYYLKPDDRFVEARETYRVHVAKMFALAGQSPADAAQSATTVFEFEKRLAEASLDNVALRDPAQ
jgi:endothelin-converting enzyme/putative endopeptidase